MTEHREPELYKEEEPAEPGRRAVRTDDEPTTVEKLKGMPWSIASNAANTVFAQYTFYGSLFVLFLSALGLSKSQMGLILSLLPFFGLMSLFVAPATERFGYKRTYMTFFGLRSFTSIGLLFTPWVLSQYGAQAALTLVTVIVAVFSLFRAIAITAMHPWVQEYVPDSVRGKYTAWNNMFTTGTGFIAVTAGGFVLARTTGLTGFMVLIGAGVVFGFISVALAVRVPGGAPRSPRRNEQARPRELGSALRDRSFVRYLLAVSAITLVTVPLGAFLPLFMREQIGLNDSGIVWLQTGTLVGTLASSFIWGWAADRYGSIPVTLYGLSLRAVLPLLWMLMPRHTEWGLTIALSIALLQGVADMGWGIGSARMLYVNIVPPAKRRDYMALYFTWTSVVGGVSQLGSGRLLDATEGFSGQFWIFTLDPYLPLFIGGIILPFVAFFLLRGIYEERGVSMGQFAGIFLRGNPFLAMSSMIRYHLARDEYATVRVTEQLGQAKSPLTVDELLEALEDPRFNVRFEAVISIGRMMPDPRLVEKLEQMLEGSELALTVVAAWALGRLGDPHAIPALERALNSQYRSIRAHAARALGALGDERIVPELLARLEQETDKGLQMAYASALGNLGAKEATSLLLKLLGEMDNPGAALELALSLARIVGNEHGFVTLARGARTDAGTTMAQAITAFRRQADQALGPEAQALADVCADRLARENLVEGALGISQLIRALPRGRFSAAGLAILDECGVRLGQPDWDVRQEYIILTLHTLMADWR